MMGIGAKGRKDYRKYILFPTISEGQHFVILLYRLTLAHIKAGFYSLLSTMTKPLQLLYNLLFAGTILSIFACEDNKIKPPSVSPFYDQADAKLWKHRVNCIESADSMAGLFPGIEIDIYYVDSTASFVCTHGEPCSGSSLETLLLSIDKEHLPYVWLDFKNSDDSLVVTKSIAILKETLTKLDMVKRTIVETKNTQCIDSLTKYGMYSSYWVPHYYDTNPSYSNDELLSTIATTIEHHRPTVVSADYHMFSFLKTHFPTAFLHLWVNNLTAESDKTTIDELKSYPNTKVILVDFDAPF